MIRRTLDDLRRQVAAGPPYPRDLLEELRQDLREGARALYARCLRRTDRATAEQTRRERMMQFEREALENGFTRVAGVDEAGRGPLAGPVVAAAVVLATPLDGLNDSKQLTPELRDTLHARLMDGTHDVGIGAVGPEEIDRWGIQWANCDAMRRAVAALSKPPDFLLIDGFRLPGTTIPHRRIVKGDCRSISIAAASIIAKVTRDRIMAEVDARYPGYGFARHKGYATEEHLEALARLGPCAIHRRSFAPLAQRPETGSLFDLGDER